MFAHLHHREAGDAAASETRGAVLNWGWFYDLLVWFLTGGREQALRQMITDLAQLQSGETVLDVGCGTGSLTRVARERVGETGRVCGIDPGQQQIARARRQAERAGLSIDFQIGMIEQLAFPDQSFDVVLSSLMMHHLPDDLKPGGRLLVFDANIPAGPWKSRIRDQPALMEEAGFSQLEAGKTKVPGLSFALGRRASEGQQNEQ
jgi:ubiquinone/menaquinone biosynthesis C-methylase UbiE